MLLNVIHIVPDIQYNAEKAENAAWSKKQQELARLEKMKETLQEQSLFMLLWLICFIILLY